MQGRIRHQHGIVVTWSESKGPRRGGRGRGKGQLDFTAPASRSVREKTSCNEGLLSRRAVTQQTACTEQKKEKKKERRYRRPGRGVRELGERARQNNGNTCDGVLVGGFCRARGEDGRMKRSRAGYITVRDDEGRVLV